MNPVIFWFDSTIFTFKCLSIDKPAIVSSNDAGKRKFQQNSGGPQPKKLKEDEELLELIEKQNYELHKLKLYIKQTVDRFWRKEILRQNDQAIPENAIDVIYFHPSLE